jgi:hypothetical protein
MYALCTATLIPNPSSWEANTMPVCQNILVYYTSSITQMLAISKRLRTTTHAQKVEKWRAFRFHNLRITNQSRCRLHHMLLFLAWVRLACDINHLLVYPYSLARAFNDMHYIIEWTWTMFVVMSTSSSMLKCEFGLVLEEFAVHINTCIHTYIQSRLLSHWRIERLYLSTPHLYIFTPVVYTWLPCPWTWQISDIICTPCPLFWRLNSV